MCGIIGTCGLSVTSESLEKALETLKLRGPEQHNSVVFPNAPASLGHTRLIITGGADSGLQPLSTPDHSLYLVCNGEIYDYKRLRTQLQEKGHLFESESDSELILHLYKEYGLPHLFEHLRGEFAFLLYDAQKRLFIAARDRFGIKPLLFTQQNGGFAFASEAKALFAAGILKADINSVSIRDFLLYIPPDSVFTGIEAVPPGHYMTIALPADGTPQQALVAQTLPYWSLEAALNANPNDVTLPTETYLHDIRQAVDEAVRLRLDTQVPVGVFLSGGIDSAAIAGTMARLRPKEPLHAFTVSFTDNAQFNELQLAKEMANSIGATLHVVPCDHDTLCAHLQDSLWCSETPSGNLHGVAKFMLSKAARRLVKVVLTGEGSDEIFLGYEYFQKARPAHPQDEDLIPKISSLQVFLLKKSWLQHLLFHSSQRPKLRTSPLQDSLAKRIGRGFLGRTTLSWQKAIQFFSIKGLLAPYILSVLADRQEMGNALEGRTPLLDHPLVELACRIPASLKIKDGREKDIFRSAMADRVIPSIANTKKWTFEAPPHFLTQTTDPKTKDLLATHLSYQALQRTRIFQPILIVMLRMVLKRLSRNSALGQKINTLLTFVLSTQILHRLYVETATHSISTMTSKGNLAT